MIRKTIVAACAAALTLAPVPAVSSTKPDAAAAVVQKHIDAYRSGDINWFVATFADDATVVANGIVATGHSEIRAFYAPNFGPGAPSISIVESGMVDGRVYFAAAYIMPDGSELCCSYSEYTVENGKITYLESDSSF